MAKCLQGISFDNIARVIKEIVIKNSSSTEFYPEFQNLYTLLVKNGSFKKDRIHRRDYLNYSKPTRRLKSGAKFFEF